MTELETGLKLVSKINDLGFDAYVVGGAVRDYIMGDPEPDDVDIATNCPVEVLEDEWKTYDIGRSKELSFGVIDVEFGSYHFEVAQFRVESDYTDGRRPDSVEMVDSLKLDVKRRDITINGLAMDAERNVIDYVGGIEDIKKGVIRAIGDPNKRLNEDYVRALRAIRFAAKFDFELDDELNDAIRNLHPRDITNITGERKKDEFWKMAKNGTVLANAIEMMVDTGLMLHILPQVYYLQYCYHDRNHHPEGDGLRHTLKALKESKSNDPDVNMAILLHDCGKVFTLEVIEGVYHYFGHDKVGSEIVREYVSELFKLSNATTNAIAFAIENHMKVRTVKKKSKVLELVNSKHWPVLREVTRTDTTCRGVDNESDIEDELNEMEESVAEWVDESKDKINLVDGNRIMEVGGLTQGPLVGEVKTKVNEWIVNEGIDVDNKSAVDKKIKEVISE